MSATVDPVASRALADVERTAQRSSRFSSLWLVPFGLFAGATLGSVARGWMRLITDDPEFSWSGTIFIVAAFAIAGLGHGIAWAARRADRRRRWSTVARVVGAVLTLPLFGGAGAIMLPTVVGAALARWRPDWRRSARAAVIVVATPTPVVLVVGVWRDGMDARRALGLLLFGATYLLIVASMRSIVAPLGDGWRMRRAVRIVLVVAGVLALLGLAMATVGVSTAEM